jgi:ribosomal protein S18 acetylase RimI-like enzyme
MGAGVLCAIAGLGVGRGLGWFWEQGHRVVRRARGQEFAIEDMPQPVHRPRATRMVVRTEESVTPDSRIRYDGSIPAADFAALMARCGLGDLDVARTEAALARTINIGAWDGDRLVGAVRLLSDGYTWWVVTDIVVDPAYRRRGIGRTLLSRAAALSSGAVTVARIPPGTEGFFRAVDLSQVYEGFVRGAKARLH